MYNNSLMSQSQILNVILVVLAVMICVSLFYKECMRDARRNTNDMDMKETMNSISFPSISNSYEDILRSSQNATRYDAHSVSRDNGLIHQIDKSETPYYHVTNKTVVSNSVNSDNETSGDISSDNSEDGGSIFSSVDMSHQTKDNTKDNTKDSVARAYNTRECNLQSDGDNGYDRFCNSDGSNLKNIKRNATRHRSGSYEDYADKNKLMFADNYEGRLTSDPFDADSVQVNMSGIDTGGFLNNNPFEELKDVNGNSCELDEETAHLKKYIREYVLDGKDQCFCAVDLSKSEFTRDEIDKYREQQLEFRDKIYGTSEIVNDAVDKMNEISMTGIKAKNKSIADFYDSIVENEYDRKGEPIPTDRVSDLNGSGFIMGTSIPTDNCIRPPELDLRSAIPQGNYTQSSNSGGRHFLRDNWMYTNENSNNGGPDFTGIKGSDPMLDQHLIIS
jgi:hypothetical protein